MTVDREIYRTRFGEESIGGKITLWEVLCAHFFNKKYIPPDSRVLDVGAGACEFLNAIEAKEKIGIDHNPDAANFAGDDIRLIIDDFDTGLATISDETIDRCMASNVFEHLPNKEYLFNCLSEIFRILAPGGKLIVMQPNFAAVKERFYDFCDHTLPLTEKGMAEALLSCGYELEMVRARFLPYTTKSRYPSWPILVRLYLLVPFVHRFMGQQMLIVARKP